MDSTAQPWENIDPTKGDPEWLSHGVIAPIGIFYGPHSFHDLYWPEWAHWMTYGIPEGCHMILNENGKHQLIEMLH